VYRLTSAFPSEERSGLISQIRRATSSVPANLAEGCGRDGNAELARFAHIALGSANELEYHVLLAHDLGYVQEDDYKLLGGQIVEIKKMLTVFIQRLRL